jgi:hypothetical protein
VRSFASLAACVAVLTGGTAALASGSALKAIETASGVVVTDYDGHPHRTAPKRVGQYINLWCRSSTHHSQTVEVRTFFAAREVAFRTMVCPQGDIPRPHHIVRVSKVGVYGMVLDGGGFDSFVIRTHTRPAEGLQAR